jgi:4-hydroxy-3-polyprenylbenzoate decarboxylase
MIHDDKNAGVYISPGNNGKVNRDDYFSRGEPYPIAIVCGMDPLIFAAATLEVPYGVSEYQWCGAIRGEPYEVVHLPITGLPVPASSEIVLEGFIYPDKMAPEGPFGEWTGYYGAIQPAEPVMPVEGPYWRNNPTMLGVPPNKPLAYDPYLYREYLRSTIMMRELRGAGIPGITDVSASPREVHASSTTSPSSRSTPVTLVRPSTQRRPRGFGGILRAHRGGRR